MEPLQVIEPTREQLLDWGARFSQDAEDETWPDVGRVTRDARAQFKSALDVGECHAAVAVLRGYPVALWALRRSHPQRFECLGGAINRDISTRLQLAAAWSILLYTLLKGREHGIKIARGTLVATRPGVRRVFEEAGVEVNVGGCDPVTREAHSYEIKVHFDERTIARTKAVLEAL